MKLVKSSCFEFSGDTTYKRRMNILRDHNWFTQRLLALSQWLPCIRPGAMVDFDNLYVVRHGARPPKSTPVSHAHGHSGATRDAGRVSTTARAGVEQFLLMGLAVSFDWGGSPVRGTS